MHSSWSEAHEALCFTKMVWICDCEHPMRHGNTETRLGREPHSAESLLRACPPLLLFHINTSYHIYLEESNRNGLWLSWVKKHTTWKDKAQKVTRPQQGQTSVPAIGSHK